MLSDRWNDEHWARIHFYYYNSERYGIESQRIIIVWFSEIVFRCNGNQTRIASREISLENVIRMRFVLTWNRSGCLTNQKQVEKHSRRCEVSFCLLSTKLSIPFYCYYYSTCWQYFEYAFFRLNSLIYIYVYLSWSTGEEAWSGCIKLSVLI